MTSARTNTRSGESDGFELGVFRYFTMIWAWLVAIVVALSLWLVATSRTATRSRSVTASRYFVLSSIASLAGYLICFRPDQVGAVRSCWVLVWLASALALGWGFLWSAVAFLRDLSEGKVSGAVALSTLSSVGAGVIAIVAIFKASPTA